MTKRKDGEAHPDDDRLIWSESGGGWVPAPFPVVRSTPAAKELPAADDLVRIVSKYRGTSPPPKAGPEILDAARLLYAALYQDCGDQARREKLEGLHLLIRWIQGQVVDKMPTEDKDRWRQFIVQDLKELGCTRTSPAPDAPTVYQVAEWISIHKRWPLGGEASFRRADSSAARDRIDQTPQTSFRPFGYRAITAEDLNAALAALRPR